MGKTVAIDKGHTPDLDTGACGFGLREVDVVDNLGERVEKKLSAYYVNILQVPRTDSLYARAAYANEHGANVFLSIHVNAGGEGEGFESYIWRFDYLDGTQADELQEAVHGAVMAYLAPMGIIDRGQKAANFAVLRLTNMPALLLECLFIDNEADAARLKSDAFMDGLANVIVWGLVQFLGLTLRAPDPTKAAILALQAKGIIASPDYWLANAKAGGTCRGEYVAGLIRNFAKWVE